MLMSHFPRVKIKSTESALDTKQGRKTCSDEKISNTVICGIISFFHTVHTYKTYKPHFDIKAQL